jgi:2-polyprenyl-6-methoxyphenol hydroxylase-like FAD-dependent oxidoreductase
MNVLVSGAGIAGLALAHWLRRHGISATIVERAPAPRTGGQAIDIRGAARDVVTRMGIMDAVRARHTGAHGLAYLDRHGRRVAEMGGDAFGDSGGVVAEIEILRNDLIDILATATGDTEIVYGDRITALDGDRVSFRHGRPRTFDVVVGADGVRSGVRALAFGPESRFVRELGTYTAYFPARTGLDLGGWELMYNAPGGRVCLLYPVGRGGEVRVLLAFRSPALADVGDPRAVLRRVFGDVGWELPNLLAQMPPDPYFARDGFVRVDGWSRGRAVLLGDAAYGGSIGMGTSMAVVGAYVLAGELATAPDAGAAFAGYESSMRDYVAANHKRDPNIDKGFAPKTARGIWLRNQMVRLMTKLPTRGAMTGDLQKTANAVTLKDYCPSPSI